MLILYVNDANLVHSLAAPTPGLTGLRHRRRMSFIHLSCVLPSSSGGTVDDVGIEVDSNKLKLGLK